MILVTGATGFIGRNLVKRLMEQGEPVRCLISQYRANHISWDTEAPNAPEVIIGSLLDDEVLFRAMAGVHTVIHLENAQWWGRFRDLERIELNGTRKLIAAARAARIGRIIIPSHLGASSASAYTLLKIKGQVEELIRASGLAYTIIRSGIVFGPEDHFINHIAMMLSVNPLFFVMPGHGEIALHPIYIDDLVEAIVRSLEHIDIVDETIEIGGPEYTTFQDMMYTIMRVTGMQRLLIPMPPYLVRTIVSIYSRIFPRSIMTPQWLDILAANRTTRINNIYEIFGIQPRRFEDTLLTYLPKRRHFFSLLRMSLRRRPRGV
ncbi:MAG: NAD-dependent epimerase/dehydratase family protein [Chloroflexi bacterium]|nr:MAG: NAD-dependent epimerase/dehydratase family protein [Chloroflexota bacterium]